MTKVKSVSSRLTPTMPTKEDTFNSSVMLSHSPCIAPVDRTRFYREYFQSESERELWKKTAISGTCIIRGFCVILVEAASVLLWDNKRHELHVAATTSSSISLNLVGQSVPLEGSIAGTVMLSQQAPGR